MDWPVWHVRGLALRIDTSGGGKIFGALFDTVWRMCS